MTSTYESTMERRAKAVVTFRAELRAALAEVLDPADVETAAVDAEGELGTSRFAQIAVERAGRDDADALLRVVYYDVLVPQARRSQSGCHFGRWRTIELAIKSRLGL